MPAPINSRTDFSQFNFGSVKRGLPEIPASAPASQLSALVDQAYQASLSGGIGKAEVAWFLRLARHPSADQAVQAAIAARLEGAPITSAARQAGFDAFLALCKQLAASGASSGGSVVDVIVGGGVVDYDRARPAAAYQVDLAKANNLWRRSPPARRVEDLFSTAINAGAAGDVSAPTHYDPAQPIKVIAYDNAWGPDQQDLARFIAPGEIMIAVKHHKPEHPTLGNAGKEAIKFDATHIEIAAGVEIDDGQGGKKPGAITLNNPQTYENGLFGDPSYPMIFFKLKFPPSLRPEEVRAYVDNIRTWLVIANTFTDFPGDYNGGDPLGTRSVTQVKTLGDKLLTCLTGTPAQKAEAEAWLADKNNMVYCAELAHVAVNLGIHVPLNKETLGAALHAQVKERIAGKEFLSDNGNHLAALVDLRLAPGSLRPLAEVLGVTPTEPSRTQPFGAGLAVRPMTMADLVEEFVRHHAPRQQPGEWSARKDALMAEIQAGLLRQAAPGLYEAMGLSALPESDPKRQAVAGLLEQIIGVVGRTYDSYADLRAALQPLLVQARMMAGPRDDGSGAFIPPHAWLLHGLGRTSNEGGLLGLELVGHGLHASILQPA